MTASDYAQIDITDGSEMLVCLFQVLHVNLTILYPLNAGSSTDLVEKILNPHYLDNELGSFSATRDILQSTAPSTSAWIGEAGGAYNSGRHLVTDAFVFSFWSVQHPTT